MLRLYSTNLIGYEDTGKQEFLPYGCDTEQLYLQNSKKDADWYYNSHRVFYDRNSNGHRSKEISQLNEDYILFLGCSITVGSSVELEHTFPYLVSKALNKDYYNLAVEGAGYDLVAHNLVNWVKISKPSLIVINWPETHRTFRIDDTNVIPYGPWHTTHLGKSNDWRNYENVITTDYFTHYSNIIKDMVGLLSIPVVTLQESSLVDYGRDLKHPGINSHRLMCENLLTQIALASSSD